MGSLTPGTRLKSTVCTTEIMVITAPPDGIEITCGGEPMNQGGDGNGGSVHQDHAEGSVIGKTVHKRGRQPGGTVRQGRRRVAVGWRKRP